MFERPVPLMAVVMDSGQVQDVVLENWPAAVTPPSVLVVDYDHDSIPPDELIRVVVGQQVNMAACHLIAACESVPEGLVPSQVLKELQIAEMAARSSPLQQSMNLLRQVLALDKALVSAQRPPTGDDYNDLYAVITHGLRNLRASLGDEPGMPESEA